MRSTLLAQGFVLVLVTGLAALTAMPVIAHVIEIPADPATAGTPGLRTL